MKSTKFYKSLSIVLIVLNLATLAFFYFTKPPHPPRPGENLISDQIGLEGTAKKAVDLLEKEHHKKKRQLMKRNFELHRQLYQNMSDTSKSQQLMSTIDANHENIEHMTFQFFHQVSEKCNKAQQQKLDDFIHKSLHMLAGQGPPRR